MVEDRNDGVAELHYRIAPLLVELSLRRRAASLVIRLTFDVIAEGSGSSIDSRQIRRTY